MGEGESKMMLLEWMDFRGTEAELKEIDRINKTIAEKVKGVEYLGRFASLNAKWNWTYFWKVPSMAKYEEMDKLHGVLSKTYKRDYNKMTHQAVEFFIGPF